MLQVCRAPRNHPAHPHRYGRVSFNGETPIPGVTFHPRGLVHFAAVLSGNGAYAPKVVTPARKKVIFFEVPPSLPKEKDRKFPGGFNSQSASCLVKHMTTPQWPLQSVSTGRLLSVLGKSCLCSTPQEAFNDLFLSG